MGTTVLSVSRRRAIVMCCTPPPHARSTASISSIVRTQKVSCLDNRAALRLAGARGRSCRARTPCRPRTAWRAEADRERQLAEDTTSRPRHVRAGPARTPGTRRVPGTAIERRGDAAAEWRSTEMMKIATSSPARVAVSCSLESWSPRRNMRCRNNDEVNEESRAQSRGGGRFYAGRPTILLRSREIKRWP